jgi:hypothetical protein
MERGNRVSVDAERENKKIDINSIQRGILAAAAAAIMASGLASQASAADTRLTINGGQTKGAFNRVASGWAAYITKNISGVNASSKASAGSLDNTRQVDAGRPISGWSSPAICMTAPRASDRSRKPHPTSAI